MACKGVCRRPEYAFTPPSAGIRGSAAMYLHGAKRCTLCSVWMSCKDNMCPCCHRLLRTRPRNRTHKSAWLDGRKVIIQSGGGGV